MATGTQIEHICEHTFQVNLPNGDIDFVTVYDLPVSIAKKFVEAKYPNLIIETLSQLKPNI